MTHKDIWKPPFETEGSYIDSSDGVSAISVVWYSTTLHSESKRAEAELPNICNLMNGTGGKKYPASSIKVIGGDILINNLTFTVCGWGHLTGSAALNLPEEEAAKLQGEFRDWIIKQITE